MTRPIIVTTGNDLAGFRIVEYLGIVRGLVVRSPNIGQGIAGGLQSIFGGNISAYEGVCESARAQAFARMTEHALQIGANGLIAVRYDATEFAQGVTEVLAYGTAVKIAA